MAYIFGFVYMSDTEQDPKSRHFGFGGVEECLDFIANQIRRTIPRPWHDVAIAVAVDDGVAKLVSIVRTNGPGADELGPTSEDAYDLLFTDLAELFVKTRGDKIREIKFQLFENGDRIVTTK